MPIPSLQLQKKPVICREAEGLVSELWSPRFVTIQWLCSQSFRVTAANQWTLVEIELLATVGWKWGCPAADVPKMWRTAEKRYVPHVCLRNPFPLFLLGIPSIQPLYQKLLHHAHPFIADRKQNPVPCTETEGLVTELWSPRFVAMSQLCFVTAANQWFNCRDWAFSLRGLEAGRPAFQLPMFPKCDALPKGDLLGMFV